MKKKEWYIILSILSIVLCVLVILWFVFSIQISNERIKNYRSVVNKTERSLNITINSAEKYYITPTEANEEIDYIEDRVDLMEEYLDEEHSKWFQSDSKKELTGIYLLKAKTEIQTARDKILALQIYYN